MRKLLSFMVVTLDGYVAGPNGEFDWPNVDDEFNDFAIRQLDSNRRFSTSSARATRWIGFRPIFANDCATCAFP